jgi:hypothetical protein
MRRFPHSINVTLDGCCNHRVTIPARLPKRLQDAVEKDEKDVGSITDEKGHRERR